jgi:hypothetical protein
VEAASSARLLEYEQRSLNRPSCLTADAEAIQRAAADIDDVSEVIESQLTQRSSTVSTDETSFAFTQISEGNHLTGTGGSVLGGFVADTYYDSLVHEPMDGAFSGDDGDSVIAAATEYQRYDSDFELDSEQQPQLIALASQHSEDLLGRHDAGTEVMERVAGICAQRRFDDGSQSSDAYENAVVSVKESVGEKFVAGGFPEVRTSAVGQCRDIIARISKKAKLIEANLVSARTSL